MNDSTAPTTIPHHIKGSKTYYQMCRGTKLIFEEVYHPGNLKDSDYVNKDLLMDRLREIARQTMREELVKVIDLYFNRGSIAYIISDLDHNVIGLSISEASFDNGNQVILPWLNIYLEEYREKGVYIICVTKSIIHFINEYQVINNLKGIMKMIPLFKKWVFISRTFNPRIYCSMLRPNMNVSPKFDNTGRIKKINVPKDEREIRTNFLKKLGYKNDEINDRSLFVIKAFSNEKENREMHENFPLSSDDSVNKFFKNHLGLDNGNLLVSTATFRPVVLVPMDKLKKQLKKTSRFLKMRKPVFTSPESETATEVQR